LQEPPRLKVKFFSYSSPFFKQRPPKNWWSGGQKQLSSNCDAYSFYFASLLTKSGVFRPDNKKKRNAPLIFQTLDIGVFEPRRDNSSRRSNYKRKIVPGKGFFSN
jgi:hypothetical protein